MKTQDVTKMAAMAVAPSLLNRRNLKWVALAAGVYYGLKFLSKKGVLPESADSALQKMDSVVNEAKAHFGMNNPH